MRAVQADRISVGNLRRSTRVPLRLSIGMLGTDGATCEGETVTVNLHGALIQTALPLTVGQKIQLEVLITGKNIGAEVVWSDPETALPMVSR